MTQSIKKYLQNANNQQNIPLLIVAFVALHTFHRYFYFGHFGFDDMEYARLANDFLQGHIDWSNHYSYRIIPICLTAISYKLFGINDLSSAVGAWLMTLLTLLGLFKIAKNEGLLIKILITLIFITYSWSLFYADKLMPDVYVMAAVVWIYERYNAFIQAQISAPKAAIAMAFLTWLGLLAKETILLIFPAFLLLFLVNIFLHKNNNPQQIKYHFRFWVSFIASFLIIGVFYMLILWAFSGDPLSRLTAMQAGEYANSCRYDLQPFSVLLERITSEFWRMCAKEGMLSPIIISLLGTIFLFIPKYKSQYSELVIFTLGLLLSANFMTISLKSYVPMCLDPRHFLYVLPFGALLLARQIKSIFDAEKPYKMLPFALLSMGAVLAFWLGDREWKDPLFGIVIGLGVYMVLEKLFAKYKTLDFMLFCIIFLVTIFYYRVENLKYVRNINYNEQKYKVLYFLEKTPPKSVIYADAALLRLMPYWLQFDTSKQFIFKNFLDNDLTIKENEIKDSLNTEKNPPPQYPPIFWLVSGHSLFLSNQSVENVSPILKLCAGDTAFHCDDRSIWATALNPVFRTKAVFKDSFSFENQQLAIDLPNIDFSKDTFFLNVLLHVRSNTLTQAKLVTHLVGNENTPQKESIQKHLRTVGTVFYPLEKNILYLPEKNKFSKNKILFSIENPATANKIDAQYLRLNIYKISKK